MTKIKVDLKTKIFSKDTRVFLARAGKGGHLFQEVLAQKAIGPDLPNLRLNIKRGLTGERNLEAKVKRSRRLKTWLQGSIKNRGTPPSDTLNEYHDVPKRSGHAQIEGIVKNYFSDLKAGDILIIPNPSYFGDAIIAEVLPLEEHTIKLQGSRRYEGYEFDARRFGSHALVKMSDLPRQVIDLAKAPTGFAQITNTAVKKRILQLGFSDFVYDDEFVSRIFTTKKDFTPFDGNVLNAFVNMVAINVQRLEEKGKTDHLIGLVAAAFEQVENDDLQVKININSPGKLSIFDRSIVPLVTAVMLGILVEVGFDASALAQDTTFEVTNSAVEKALDLCSEPVSRLAENMLKFLPEDEFQASCDLLRSTHEDTGANVDVKVKVEND